MTAIVALAGLAGCGSDTSAGVFIRVTPTPAALRQVGTALPTATPIPDGA